MSAVYSPAQIRAAFYAAATKIDGGAPYDFHGIDVGGHNIAGRFCGPCMWGHVGQELGMSSAALVSDVAREAGVEPNHLYALHSEIVGTVSFNNRDAAAKVLRAYADRYFPAPVASPPRTDVIPWSDMRGLWVPKALRGEIVPAQEDAR